jgi:hypothetical protein
VSLSWHIDTCVFTLAHSHACLYLGTLTHVFILVRVSKFLHRTNRVLAFATTHEQPFTLSLYGIGSLPIVRRCFRNEYRCAHLRPPSAGQTVVTITMYLRTPHRLRSDTLHSHDVSNIHFPRLVVNFNAETHWAIRSNSHYEILVGRNVQSRFRPFIKLSTEERLTDLRHLLPPNGT